MSAPRIKVKRSRFLPLVRAEFHWHCTADERWRVELCGYGWEHTPSAAADAGLAHLAAYHTAPMPHRAHGDPDGVKVAQNHAGLDGNTYPAALDTAYNEGARR